MAENQDGTKADIGIVTGLPIEMRPFLLRCGRVRKYTGDSFTFHGGRFEQTRVVIVETGRGLKKTRRATQALIDGHSPDWILSCGLSGSCDSELKLGDIVVADQTCHPGGDSIFIDVKMQDGPGLKVGSFVSTDEFTRAIKQKADLAAKFDAIACDTDSYAVASVCREQKKRFMAIRVISDDMSIDLPSEILSVLGNSGSMRWGAAVKSVWKRPGSVKDIWNLRENAVNASERLADFLEGVVDQLAKVKS